MSFLSSLENLRVYNLFFKRRFFYLFLALLVPYLLHPLAKTEVLGISLLDLAFSLILFVGIFAVSEKRHVAMSALALVLLTQALTWATHYFPLKPLIFLGLCFNCIYLIYTAILLFDFVIRQHTVTVNTIFASLCIYLLFGLLWAFIYSIIQFTNPESFYINFHYFGEEKVGRHIFQHLYYFMYFSFTTLTTLDFGDIIPTASWSRVFTSLEAIVGQLYLVVIVSHLVGLHISQTIRLKTANKKED